jgi:hypothetical protein
VIVSWFHDPAGRCLTVSYSLGAGDPPEAVQLIASGQDNPRNKQLPIFDASAPCNSARSCVSQACAYPSSVHPHGIGVELETRGEDDDELWASFAWTPGAAAMIRGGTRYLIVGYRQGSAGCVCGVSSFGLSKAPAMKPKPPRQVPLAQAPVAPARSDDWRNPAINLSAFDVDSGMLFRAGDTF